jgi:four helix bundle protein
VKRHPYAHSPGSFKGLTCYQFCRQSRGSLYELVDHLIICQDEGYIDNELFTAYRADCIRAIQLINGYISYLSKQKEKQE